MPPEIITLILVGCGGTGSFAAHTLAQFTRWSLDQGVDTRLYFVDPDKVETKNLTRQNFCPAEVGLPKAFTLAWRYSAALGLKITSFVQPFDLLLLRRFTPRNFQPQQTSTIVIGAVDNYCARRDIAKALTALSEEQKVYKTPRQQYWWIDAGNELYSGQVIIGNSLEMEPQLSPLGYCTGTPYPHLQEPSLIMPRKTTGQGHSTSSGPAPDEALSCAELTALGDQSAMINRAMATWLGIYLYRLLKDRNLDIQATFTNIKTGATRSSPISHGTTVIASPPAPTAVQQALTVLEHNETPENDETTTGEDTPTTCPECLIGNLIIG